MKAKSKEKTAKDPELSHVEIEIDLAPGDRIQLTVEALPGDGGVQVRRETLPAVTPATIGTPRIASASSFPSPQPAVARQPAAWGVAIAAWWAKVRSRKLVFDARFLFGIALFVYFLTRFINLPAFPIYFFCDEATNTVHAADLIARGGYANGSEFLPTYFTNTSQLSLSTSVYAQIPGYLLFGKSVWATRGSFALITLLAAIWLALTLRDVFKSRYWWSAPLFLAVVPGWFIHSRAAFEVSLLVTFFTGFIYYYLLYRTSKPRALFAAIVCGALAFYSYTPGQVMIVGLGVMLLISDFRYHWQQRKTVLWGLLVLLITILPLIRFLLDHPNIYVDRLALYGSFWVKDIPVIQKIGNYLANYVQALNPRYLFFYTTQDFPRFLMLGYGQIGWPMLPLLLGGLYLVVRNIRSSPWRVLLFALLASPLGLAMVGVNANRVQTTIIPVILLGALALGALFDFILKLRPRWSTALTYGLLVFLLGNSFSLTSDALINGPTWFKDYGLDGMQWGAEQVFRGAMDYLKENPTDRILISPNWTFQTDVLQNFFVPSDYPISFGGVDRYLVEVVPDVGSTVLVLPPWDYQQVLDSGKFREIKVENIIPYPDGTDGFYFVRLAYRDDIQALFAKEKELRLRPEEAHTRLLNQDVVITYSRLDDMSVENAFDDNTDSLIKTVEMNPLVVHVDFSQPLEMNGLRARVGAEPIRLTVVLTLLDDTQKTFTLESDISDGNKDMELDFGSKQQLKSIHIEVLDILGAEKDIVHLWEITFLQ